MRLKVILSTRSSVKVLGSVMDAALERGHELDICMRPRAFRERVLTTDFERWPSTADPKAPADATVAVRLDEFVCEDAGLRVVVPYFAEFLMRPPTDYDDTMLCYPSYELRSQHAGLGPVTGWTQADHARTFRADRAPRNSHIFFSMKRDVPRRKRVPYLRIALVDRYLAHRRGMDWLVKTRDKHRDPWWLRVLADGLYGDECMYPHTSHTLLAEAASMSHFTSGAVAEAVLHNVQTLWYRQYDHRYHLKPHQRQSDDYLQPWLMSRDTYVERFLGFDDGFNGFHVIEAIERSTEKWVPRSSRPSPSPTTKPSGWLST